MEEMHVDRLAQVMESHPHYTTMHIVGVAHQVGEKQFK